MCQIPCHSLIPNSIVFGSVRRFNHRFVNKCSALKCIINNRIEIHIMLSARVTINVYEIPAQICPSIIEVAKTLHSLVNEQCAQQRQDIGNFVSNSDSLAQTIGPTFGEHFQQRRWRAGGGRVSVFVCVCPRRTGTNGPIQSSIQNQSCARSFRFFLTAVFRSHPYPLHLGLQLWTGETRRQRHGTTYTDVHSFADINSLGKHREQYCSISPRSEQAGTSRFRAGI